MEFNYIKVKDNCEVYPAYDNVWMGAIQSVGDVRQRVESSSAVAAGRRGGERSVAPARPIRLRADTNFKWPRPHSCALLLFISHLNENKSDVTSSTFLGGNVLIVVERMIAVVVVNRSYSDPFW